MDDLDIVLEVLQLGAVIILIFILILHIMLLVLSHFKHLDRVNLTKILDGQDVNKETCRAYKTYKKLLKFEIKKLESNLKKQIDVEKHRG